MKPKRCSDKNETRQLSAPTTSRRSGPGGDGYWPSQLLHELPSPVFALDAQGSIVFWNRRCEEITGYESKEIVGNPHAPALLWPGPADREQVAQQWSRSRDFACEVTGKDGRVRCIQWHVMSDRFPVAGWSSWAVGNDLTELPALRQVQQPRADAEAVLNALPDRIIVMDLDGHIEFANRQFLHEVGRTPEQVLGKTPSDLGVLSGEQFQRLMAEVVPKLIAAGTLANIEIVAQRQGGHSFPALLSFGLLRSATGEPQAVVGSGRDIQVIKEAQAATAEKERMLQALFHAIPESLLLLDREGRVLICNETAAQRLAGSIPELIGTFIFDYLAGAATADTCRERRARFTEVLGSGKPVHFTDKRADLVLESTVYPILDDQGHVASVVVFARDVTEHRQAQQELHEYRERMRNAERLASLGALGAELGHELTQPLSVVRLANQTALAELERRDCPEAVKQDLQASLAASAAIAAIASRFRDFAGRSTRTRETEVQIDRVTEWTFRLLEPTARQAKVSLRAESLDTLPALRMRENDLEQLFFTLVQNAIQAADGTEDRCLVITGALQEGQIVLQFQDNCGGIEPGHLPRIFEPFFTTKPPGRGTGLGLCIARRLARAQGGQISVHNRYREGVTFTVTLPMDCVQTGEIGV
jgi:PAS domain S-box-containing protein